MGTVVELTSCTHTGLHVQFARIMLYPYALFSPAETFPRRPEGWKGWINKQEAQ